MTTEIDMFAEEGDVLDLALPKTDSLYQEAHARTHEEAINDKERRNKVCNSFHIPRSGRQTSSRVSKIKENHENDQLPRDDYPRHKTESSKKERLKRSHTKDESSRHKTRASEPRRRESDKTSTSDHRRESTRRESTRSKPTRIELTKKSESARSEHIRSRPRRTERVRIETAKSEPVSNEPSRTVPKRSEPMGIKQSRYETHEPIEDDSMVKKPIVGDPIDVESVDEESLDEEPIDEEAYEELEVIELNEEPNEKRTDEQPIEEGSIEIIQDDEQIGTKPINTYLGENESSENEPIKIESIGHELHCIKRGPLKVEPTKSSMGNKPLHQGNLTAHSRSIRKSDKNGNASSRKRHLSQKEVTPSRRLRSSGPPEFIVKEYTSCRFYCGRGFYTSRSLREHEAACDGPSQQF